MAGDGEVSGEELEKGRMIGERMIAVAVGSGAVAMRSGAVATRNRAVAMGSGAVAAPERRNRGARCSSA